MNEYILKTIKTLREKEELILYNNLIQISAVEEVNIVNFLSKEYISESTNYPHSSPPFDEIAALWSAQTLYKACQLIIYRENKDQELPFLLPLFDRIITPSSILSADLCLRFLPLVINEIKKMDPEDLILIQIHQILKQFHYSAIGYLDDYDEIDFTSVIENKCVEQLYINRIIEKKDIKFGQSPVWKDRINTSMGNYKNIFWKEFELN